MVTKMHYAWKYPDKTIVMCSGREARSDQFVKLMDNMSSCARCLRLSQNPHEPNGFVVVPLIEGMA